MIWSIFFYDIINIDSAGGMEYVNKTEDNTGLHNIK